MKPPRVELPKYLKRKEARDAMKHLSLLPEDSKFSDRYSERVLYSMPNGEIWEVLNENRLIAIWSSMEHRERWFNQYDSKPSHLLREVFVSGDNFPQMVTTRLEELAKGCGLALPLEYSTNELQIVSRFVRKRKSSYWLDNPESFESLIAYTGEYIRHHGGGEWEMRVEPSTEQWEPWIRRPDGTFRNPWLVIYKEIHEDGRAFQSAVESSLAKVR